MLNDSVVNISTILFLLKFNFFLSLKNAIFEILYLPLSAWFIADNFFFAWNNA